MKLNLRLAKAESLVRPVYSIHTLFERVKYDSGEIYSTVHMVYTRVASAVSQGLYSLLCRKLAFNI